MRSSTLKMTIGVAARRKAVPIDRASSPSASRAKPRTVVSPPAKNRSLAGRSLTSSTIGCPSGPITGSPSSLTRTRSRGKPRARPTRAPAATTERAQPRQPDDSRRLAEALDEARPASRARAPPRRLSTPISRAARRVEHIVARVAPRRATENFDSRTCGNSRSMSGRSSIGDALVEELATSLSA